jgi:alpha-L-fucosidase
MREFGVGSHGAVGDGTTDDTVAIQLPIAMESTTGASAALFQPSWDSLAQMVVPDWFRDAKYGIFLHWGVQSVAANDGWYARHMYLQQGAAWGDAYGYHLAHFGHPSTFGYKDLIPRWTAESWDPLALAALFRSVGARYLVPVAVFHDNVDNYASSYQPWNSVRLGPHRDVVGEWASAARAQDLRFGVSSHSDRCWSFFHPSHGSDQTGPLAGVPYDGNLTLADGAGTWWEGLDPVDLYGPGHGPEDPPEEAFIERWYRRTLELVDNYRPDLLYFDSPLPFDGRGLEVAAHFYNANAAWHEGKPEAVLNVKSYGQGSIPDERAVVLDIEKGQSATLRDRPWQTDTSLLGHWFWTPGPLSLSATVVVHNLCDIVSKNGNLLLNVGLRADGTLPSDQEALLTEVGSWLEVNGEAIYGTRPWTTYGEGPTEILGGDFQENMAAMTDRDIRFTTRPGKLYALVLGWPVSGRLTIESLAAGMSRGCGPIERVRLLGSGVDLAWEEDAAGLQVRLPSSPPCPHAVTLELSLVS